jgi:UDP-N-acetylmuramate dehydrogenase
MACWRKSVVRIRCAESLQDRNTLALPAAATALGNVESLQDLHQGLEWAASRHLPVIPLGEGSNVVFAGDLSGLALGLANRGIELLDSTTDGVVLRIAAGENWHALVSWCCAQGYHGLENLALIPGTVGAAPIQNIGAYGVELSSLLRKVHAVEIDSARSLVLDAEACEFAYRDSVFKGRLRDRVVITAVELALSRIPEVNTTYPSLAAYLHDRGIAEPSPRQVLSAVTAIRRARLPDPQVEPNAGSFFKNPVVTAEQAGSLAQTFPGLPLYPQGAARAKLPAAWLIESCGWKGHRQGGVGVHPEHALVLVHYGDATGAELLALAERITESVAERFEIHLEVEPRIYGR